MDSNLNILRLTLAKNDACLLYFLLEANEGICFYSTLSSSLLPPGLAMIELKFHPSTSEDVHQLLSFAKSNNFFSFEIQEALNPL